MKTSLDWKSSWVTAVEENFSSSYNYYKAKATQVASQSEVDSKPADAFISNFLKRKRPTVVNQTEEEFQRCDKVASIVKGL